MLYLFLSHIISEPIEGNCLESSIKYDNRRNLYLLFLTITSNENAILGTIFSVLCIEKGVYTEYP